MFESWKMIFKKKKKNRVLWPSLFLILLFVLGVYFKKGHQAEKRGLWPVKTLPSLLENTQKQEKYWETLEVIA